MASRIGPKSTPRTPKTEQKPSKPKTETPAAPEKPNKGWGPKPGNKPSRPVE